MKALSKLWDQPIVRCPFVSLLCQLAVREGVGKCAINRTFKTCERIQAEVVGKKPQER